MTAQPIDPMDVLMGGSNAATAKFTNPGDTVGGPIVAPPRSHQEREYDRNNPGKGAPKVFPSGDPIMGITIDVQTNQRDPYNTDDDGVRRIYVEGKRMKAAVREAVIASGSSKLEVGGVLQVTFTGLGQAENSTINAPKEWSAAYTPAAQAAVLGQQPAPQPTQPQVVPPQQPLAQAPVQQQPAQTVQTAVGQVNANTGEIQQPAAGQLPVQPPQQPVAAPTPQGPTPEQVAAIRAAGLDPAAVFPGYQG